MGGGNKQFLGVCDHHNLPAHCPGDETPRHVWLLCRAKSAGACHGFPLDARDEATNIGADGLCVRCTNEDSHEVSSNENVAMGSEAMAVTSERDSCTATIPL